MWPTIIDLCFLLWSNIHFFEHYGTILSMFVLLQSNLDFPHMSTLKTHMRSIIFNNFDPFREPLQVKFQDCADRRVDNFTIQYIDGFAKGLICQGIVGLIDLLES